MDLGTCTKFPATEVCQDDASGILSLILAGKKIKKNNAGVAGLCSHLLISRYASFSRQSNMLSNIILFYLFKDMFQP